MSKALLRTEETYQKYQDLIAAGGLKGPCALCGGEAIKEFEHWKIMVNAYPYDRIAKLHHMILPKRHASEGEITQEEWYEYGKIKKEYLHNEYQFLIEATNKTKSIPTHFHVHLVVLKD